MINCSAKNELFKIHWSLRQLRKDASKLSFLSLDSEKSLLDVEERLFLENCFEVLVFGTDQINNIFGENQKESLTNFYKRFKDKTTELYYKYHSNKELESIEIKRLLKLNNVTFEYINLCNKALIQVANYIDLLPSAAVTKK